MEIQIRERCTKRSVVRQVKKIIATHKDAEHPSALAFVTRAAS